MDVIALTADTAEEFVSAQPVTAILYHSPNARHSRELIDEFKSVASSFAEHIAFGSVDLSTPENAILLEKAVVVIAPTLIYYRFGQPSGEDVGHDAIMKWLDLESIVHNYGHTDSWLKLLR